MQTLYWRSLITLIALKEQKRATLYSARLSTQESTQGESSRPEISRHLVQVSDL